MLTLKRYSRHGRELSVPPSCVPVTFDSEIWYFIPDFYFGNSICRSGRGNYQLIQDNVWDFLRFIVFDVPESGPVFEDRFKKLLNNIDPEHHVAVSSTIGRKMNIFLTLFIYPQAIKSAGISGTSLSSLVTFSETREKALLLVSPTHFTSMVVPSCCLNTRYRDCVKLFVNIFAGNTRPRCFSYWWRIQFNIYRSVVRKPEALHFSYSWLCRPDGTSFMAINTIHAEGLKPKKGDVVTFTYFNSQASVPVNPQIVRVRSDMNWETVCQLETVSAAQTENGNFSFTYCKITFVQWLPGKL